MSMSLHYLESVKDLYKYYQILGARAIDQLTQEQLHARLNTADNNIATIVKHVAGNMKSRFTDFLTADGEKPWRHRDTEFQDTIKEKKEILLIWNQSWEMVINTISKLTEDQVLTQTVYIRNQGHTITEALNRQLGHYAYHTGQIAYVAKSLLGDQWQSLSIPKGASQQFNNSAFATKPENTSYIKDWLKRQNFDNPI